MRRRILGAVCLIGLASAALAQGTDTPVQLRYRFQPGQEFHYRMTMNGEMPVTMGGITPPPGANMPGKIPVTMNWTMEMVQKVKSVTPEGVAAISFGMDKMEMTTTMMGMNMVARLGAGGKMESLMNGQPFTLPNMPATTFPNPFYEASVDPTGKISGINPDSTKALSQLFRGQNIASMFNGMPGMGGLILPEKPIKPGDTWDSTYNVHVPIQMPGLGAGAPGQAAGATLPLSFIVHNKLARVENGYAIIETQMSASASPGTKMAPPGGPGTPPGLSMTMEKLSQSVTGTLRFQMEQGSMESGDYDARMMMQMAMGPPPGMAGAAPGAPAKAAPKKSATGPGAAPTPGAAAPGGLKIGVDGTLKLKVERLAAAEAPPAAPTAPAAP